MAALSPTSFANHALNSKSFLSPATPKMFSARAAPSNPAFISCTSRSDSKHLGKKSARLSTKSEVLPPRRHQLGRRGHHDSARVFFAVRFPRQQHRSLWQHTP